MARDDGSFRGERFRRSARRIGVAMVWVSHLAMCGFALLIGGLLFAEGAHAWLGDGPGKAYAVSGGIILALGTAGLVFSRRLVNRTIKDMTWWKRWR